MRDIFIFVCVLALLGVTTVVGLVVWWRALAGSIWQGIWRNRPLLAAFLAAELAVWWVTAATWHYNEAGEPSDMDDVAIVVHFLLVVLAGALVGWCLRPPVTTPVRSVLAAAGAGLLVIEFNLLFLNTAFDWLFHLLHPAGYAIELAGVLEVLAAGAVAAPISVLLGAAGGLLALVITLSPWRGRHAGHPSAGVGAI